MAELHDIARIDADLKECGIPVRNRPLEVFKRLYGALDSDFHRSDPIIDWYLSNYGAEVHWDGILGTFPILIRERLYIGKAPYIYEDKPGLYKEQIIDLPRNISNTFDDCEFQHVAKALNQARILYSSIRTLDMREHILVTEAKDLFQMGCRDLDSAVALLGHTKNVQGSIVASHEAAEKFLKIALLKSSSNVKPRKFRHDIPALFTHLSSIEPRYNWLRKPVHNLDKFSPSMDMRYKLMRRSEKNAVSAFNSSLYICGALAQIWLFDYARKGDLPTFKECQFYKSGWGSTYYCKKTTHNEAVLTLFRSSRKSGAQMVDSSVGKLMSSLYLEVKDPIEDNQLRSQLIEILRNPGRLAAMEEVQREHGDEGEFQSILIRKQFGPD